ncbi:MAG: manganese catalase family protein, partial [Ferruginibacter sp.]
EEFSHLEIVGATIQMLLTGINGDLKNAAENSEIMQLLDGKAAKENMIHKGMVAPQLFVGTAGGPAYTNSQGVPWTAAYINGDVQGDLTSDLRSNIGAEPRAKMVYEYLLQFTDDAYVKETLNFLMTREVAHYQMFEAALNSIQPNFPPGVLQSDPKYSNLYFNFSNGNNFQGPWNEGKSTQLGETFQFIADPIQHSLDTNGLLNQQAEGTDRTETSVKKMEKDLGTMRSEEVTAATPMKDIEWNVPSSLVPGMEQEANGMRKNGKKTANAKSKSSDV